VRVLRILRDGSKGSFLWRWGMEFEYWTLSGLGRGNGCRIGQREEVVAKIESGRGTIWMAQ
jgi:hypothetical protein